MDSATAFSYGYVQHQDAIGLMIAGASHEDNEGPPLAEFLNKCVDYCSSQALLDCSKMLIIWGVSAIAGEFMGGGAFFGSAIIFGTVCLVLAAGLTSVHSAATAIKETEETAPPTSGLLERFINCKSMGELSLVIVDLGLGVVSGEVFGGGTLKGVGLVVGLPIVAGGILMNGVCALVETIKEAYKNEEEYREHEPTAVELLTRFTNAITYENLLTSFTDACKSERLLNTGKLMAQFNIGEMIGDAIVSGPLGMVGIVAGCVATGIGLLLWGIPTAVNYFSQTDAEPVSKELLTRFTEFVGSVTMQDALTFVGNVGLGVVQGELFDSDKLTGPGLIIGLPILGAAVIAYCISWAMSPDEPSPAGAPLAVT